MSESQGVGSNCKTVEEGGADVNAPNGFDRRAALGELFYGVLKQTKLLVAIVILGLLNRGAV